MISFKIPHHRGIFSTFSSVIEKHPQKQLKGIEKID
jgi:hypothetical protein